MACSVIANVHTPCTGPFPCLTFGPTHAALPYNAPYAANDLCDCDMSVTHHLRYGCKTQSHCTVV